MPKILENQFFQNRWWTPAMFPQRWDVQKRVSRASALVFASHNTARFCFPQQISKFSQSDFSENAHFHWKPYTKSMVWIQHPKISSWSRKFSVESRSCTLSDLLSCSMRKNELAKNLDDVGTHVLSKRRPTLSGMAWTQSLSTWGAAY